MQAFHKILIVIALILIAGNLAIDRWPTTLHYGDSNGYYLHVVSAFVHHDVGDYSKSIGALKEVNPRADDPREDVFGVRLTDKGRRYIKYTLGVPVLETPFFFLAHLYASYSEKYAANGWTRPYMLSVGFAVVAYIIWGIWLLMLVLRSFFPAKVVVLTVLSLVIATNLFYQATYVTMSHGFLFFLHALLIYLSARFYDSPRWPLALALGLTLGLITLSRVPEIIAVFVPLLWGVSSKEGLRERIRFFGKHLGLLVPAVLGFVVVFSLQLAYWYYVSGQLFFNPYQGEGFDFLRPHILRAFFDFKNGWLIYTPIMALAIVGLFYLRRFGKVPLYAILLTVGAHVYIHYSYYVWSYFPGFGQRPMVEMYPLLSFGLAATYARLSSSRNWAWLPPAALLLFGGLNLFQTWQSKKGIIWSENHNGAFYWETFGTLTPTLNSLRAYDTRSLQPKESKVAFVSTLYLEGFELTNADYSDDLTTEQAYSGKRSLYSRQVYYELLAALPLANLSGGDWLKVSTQVMMTTEDRIYDRSRTLAVVVELYNAEGKKRRGRKLRLSPQLGNEDYSIWWAGKADEWGASSFYVKLPPGIENGWTAKIYLTNEGEQRLYLDDFRVDHYRNL